MGIIFLIIGGILGYYLSEKVVAKNWLVKLAWAIGAPLAVLLLVLLVLGLVIGNSYEVGGYAAFVFIMAVPYAIFVLAKMKRKNKG